MKMEISNHQAAMTVINQCNVATNGVPCELGYDPCLLYIFKTQSLPHCFCSFYDIYRCIRSVFVLYIITRHVPYTEPYSSSNVMKRLEQDLRDVPLLSSTKNLQVQLIFQIRTGDYSVERLQHALAGNTMASLFTSGRQHKRFMVSYLIRYHGHSILSSSFFLQYQNLDSLTTRSALEMVTGIF